MDEISVIHDHLDLNPQNLHLSIWKAKSTQIEGIIAGFHGLTSHADQCFHYLGPYMADHGWTTVAIDMPGMGHWIPEKSKAEKEHWKKTIEAVTSLLKFCKKIAPDKKLVLVGVSMGVLHIIEYIFNQNEGDSLLPNCTMFAVPSLHATIPFYVYPFALPLSFLAPNIKIGLKKFIPSVKSNDPNSIINNDDPYS